MNKNKFTLAAAAFAFVAMPMIVSADDTMAPAEPTMGQKIENTAHKAGVATKDTGITTEVKAKLAADSNLSAMDIHVTTKGGVVTLTGMVDQKPQIELAEKVVKEADGVKKVRNKLTVKG
jgi:hyperosmotically inducible protein